MRNLALPMLFKEFAVLMRGSRAALLLMLYIGLTIIAARLLYGVVVSQLDRGAPLLAAQIGQVLFIGLSLGLQALTIFLAPATTVNAISAEHERGTFELLLATPLAAGQVVIGKLLAALAFLLLLLVSTLPVFTVIALFGGVGPADIVRVLATLLATAVAGCMFGMFCSAATRQTYSATLLCYALLIALVGGSLLAANVWSLVNAQRPAPPALVVANPLSAMAAALAPARPPDSAVTGGLRPLVLLNLLTRGSIDSGGGGAVVPLHRASILLFGALTIAMFWATLYVSRPLRRWRVGTIDLAILIFLVGYLLLINLARAWWMPGLFPGAGAP